MRTMRHILIALCATIILGACSSTVRPTSSVSTDTATHNSATQVADTNTISSTDWAARREEATTYMLNYLGIYMDGPLASQMTCGTLEEYFQIRAIHSIRNYCGVDLGNRGLRIGTINPETSLKSLGSILKTLLPANQKDDFRVVPQGSHQVVIAGVRGLQFNFAFDAIEVDYSSPFSAIVLPLPERQGQDHLIFILTNKKDKSVSTRDIKSVVNQLGLRYRWIPEEYQQIATN